MTINYQAQAVLNVNYAEKKGGLNDSKPHAALFLKASTDNESNESEVTLNLPTTLDRK